jgi:hypothetical protein
MMGWLEDREHERKHIENARKLQKQAKAKKSKPSAKKGKK